MLSLKTTSWRIAPVFYGRDAVSIQRVVPASEKRTSSLLAVPRRPRLQVALDAVQSCQTVHAYRDVLRTIAAGEVHPHPLGGSEGTVNARKHETRNIEFLVDPAFLQQFSQRIQSLTNVLSSCVTELVI